jgi:hypothetical protein
MKKNEKFLSTEQYTVVMMSKRVFYNSKKYEIIFLGPKERYIMIVKKIESVFGDFEYDDEFRLCGYSV